MTESEYTVILREWERPKNLATRLFAPFRVTNKFILLQAFNNYSIITYYPAKVKRAKTESVNYPPIRDIGANFSQQ